MSIYDVHLNGLKNQCGIEMQRKKKLQVQKIRKTECRRDFFFPWVIQYTKPLRDRDEERNSKILVAIHQHCGDSQSQGVS